MKALLALVPIALFAAASCGTGGMSTSPPPEGNGSGENTSSGHVATCMATCQKAADCGTPGDPLYDPSHFACNAGRCAWQGCKSASECSTAAHGGHFLCMATGGAPAPVCVPACQKAADCVAPGNTDPMGDASHFACNAGACEWTGCRATSECVASTHTSKVACAQPAGATTKTCVPTCNTSADCASAHGGPLSDAAHYACKGGLCEWTGCHSTAECAQVLQSSRYVCE